MRSDARCQARLPGNDLHSPGASGQGLAAPATSVPISFGPPRDSSSTAGLSRNNLNVHGAEARAPVNFRGLAALLRMCTALRREQPQ